MLKKIFFLLYCFYTSLFINAVVFRFFPWSLRKLFLRLCGCKFKKKAKIDLNTYFLEPRRLNVGQCSHINQGCIVDARGFIRVGENVSISHRVSLITGSHNINSPSFYGVFKPIIIDDYVFVGCNATILGGTHLGEGCVVCAGAVVTKDVPPYCVVAGVPAKVIAERARNLKYCCVPAMFT